MRVFTVRFLALAVAVGLASTLVAQPRPGGFGGRTMDASMLLTQKSVQEDMKLSADQITKIETISKELREKSRDAFKDAGKDKDKLTELFKKMAEDRKKAYTGILKPDQTKRLNQIEVQLGGIQALAKDDNKKTLKLTDKQESDLKAASEDVRKDSGEIFKDIGRDFSKMGEATEKIRKLNHEAAAKFVKSLSADQQKTYKEMVGEEFKGKIEMQRGGRPGGDKGKGKKDKGDR